MLGPIVALGLIGCAWILVAVVRDWYDRPRDKWG